MSWWDKVYNEASGAADKILGAYTEIEKAKAGSFQNARAEQTAARYVPHVDSQNRGEPVSVKPQTTERPLVGDNPQPSGMDKKWLYIGGGVGALLLVVGLVVIAKK